MKQWNCNLLIWYNWEDDGWESFTVKIPNDNPEGFCGEITLSVFKGKLKKVTVPRETLNIEKRREKGIKGPRFSG